MLPPAVRYRAPRRQEIPWGREFFRSGAGFCRFSPFRIETWQVSSRFPGAVNREAGRAEQRIAATVQGAAAAEQRTPGTHRPISSCVNRGAIDHAIAAILAAFKTGGRRPDETDHGGDQGGGKCRPRCALVHPRGAGESPPRPARQDIAPGARSDAGRIRRALPHPSRHIARLGAGLLRARPAPAPIFISSPTTRRACVKRLQAPELCRRG